MEDGILPSIIQAARFILHTVDTKDSARVIIGGVFSLDWFGG